MSTDTTTQDGEDRRLPATWEEFQRARREAAANGFNAGATRAALGVLGSVSRAQSAADYARETYPITKRVPRVVRVLRPYGEFYVRASPTRVGLSFYEDRGCTRYFSVTGLFPEEPAIFADLLANPQEEVTE